MRFKGKTVLVTGASSGIGYATAVAFARQGADLLLAARREERLVSLAGQLEKAGVRALPVRCDITSPSDVEELAHRAEQVFGGLDVLVNNAGVGLFGPLEKIGEDQLRAVFEVNVFALWRVTCAMLPLMRRRQGGKIVNVSSVLGHRGLPMLGGYCASKAAVNALTESLRIELKPEGIDVLLVSPGLTRSEFRKVRMHAPGHRQEQIPLREMSAEAVAEAIVRACWRNRRHTVLTLPGRAMVYANRLWPALFDRFASRLVGPAAPEEGGKA